MAVGQDAAVPGRLPVQALKVPTIVGQYAPAKAMSQGQNASVRSSPKSILWYRQLVMAKLAQFLDHGIGEILVGVEEHSRSLHEPFFTFFVFPDGPIDFL